MKPILLDFPSSFHTDRLYIRCPKPGDGSRVNASILASLNELKPWLPFAQKAPSVDETEANLRQAYANFITREDLRFLIFHKEEGYLIGSTGLHRINWDVPKFEIGYWIDTRYSKQGYMTEAIAALTSFAFNELRAKRIEIRCDAENTASRRVPEKLDFLLEGILVQEDVGIENDLRDTCIYALTK